MQTSLFATKLLTLALWPLNVGRETSLPQLFVPLQAGERSSLLDPESMMVINAALPKDIQVGACAAAPWWRPLPFWAWSALENWAPCLSLVAPHLYNAGTMDTNVRLGPPRGLVCPLSVRPAQRRLILPSVARSSFILSAHSL